jgi:hypothetical protein
VLGSIIGNYIVLIGWRWCFRIMTILVGLNTLSIMTFMNETYSPCVSFEAPSVLPSDVVPRICKATFEARGVAQPKQSIREHLTITPKARDVIIHTFSRPPRMLVNPLCALFITCELQSPRRASQRVSDLLTDADYAYVYVRDTESMNLMLQTDTVSIQSIIYVFLVALCVEHS